MEHIIIKPKIVIKSISNKKSKIKHIVEITRDKSKLIISF